MPSRTLIEIPHSADCIQNDERDDAQISGADLSFLCFFDDAAIEEMNGALGEV
jgi:hypothetical protein